MENSLLPRAVKWIGKLKWLLAGVAIYACLQGTSFLMFHREQARMNALICLVGCLNGAIERWENENRKLGPRVPELKDMADFMKLYRSIMGETLEMPEQVAGSSRVVLPARVLTFPKGSKVSIRRELSFENGRYEVQRPGEPAGFWLGQERAGWIPFLWMVKRH